METLWRELATYGGLDGDSMKQQDIRKALKDRFVPYLNT